MCSEFEVSQIDPSPTPHCLIDGDRGFPSGMMDGIQCLLCAVRKRLIGGMGNIARSPLESPYPIEAETSGYPRFTEAARYWLQWAGIPDSIYSKSAFRNDYQDDIYARPRWVNYLKEQTHIPIDMAFASLYRSPYR